MAQESELSLLHPDEDWAADVASHWSDSAPAIVHDGDGAWLKLLDKELAKAHSYLLTANPDQKPFLTATITRFRVQSFFKTVKGFHDGDLDLSGRFPERWDWYSARYAALLSGLAELAPYGRQKRQQLPWPSKNLPSELRKLLPIVTVIKPESLLDAFHVKFGLPPGLFPFHALVKLAAEAGGADARPQFQRLRLLDLPNEILDRVAELAELPEKAALASTCTTWRDVATRHLYLTFRAHIGQPRSFDRFTDGGDPRAVLVGTAKALKRFARDIDRHMRHPRAATDMEAFEASDEYDSPLSLAFDSDLDHAAVYGAMRPVLDAVDASLGRLLTSAINLTCLKLWRVPVGARTVRGILGLEKLVHIELFIDALDEGAVAVLRDPADLAPMPSVRQVQLTRGRALYATLGFLACFPNAEVLIVRGNGRLDTNPPDNFGPPCSPLKINFATSVLPLDAPLLASWFRRLASRNRLRLSFFRLTLDAPLASWLVAPLILPPLAAAHALVHLDINGVLNIMPTFVADIAAVAPQLEHLGLINRTSGGQFRSHVNVWPRPLDDYARELAAFPRLTSFLCNHAVHIPPDMPRDMVRFEREPLPDASVGGESDESTAESESNESTSEPDESTSESDSDGDSDSESDGGSESESENVSGSGSDSEDHPDSRSDGAPASSVGLTTEELKIDWFSLFDRDAALVASRCPTLRTVIFSELPAYPSYIYKCRRDPATGLVKTDVWGALPPGEADKRRDEWLRGVRCDVDSP